MPLYYLCLCLQVIYSGENRLQTLPARFGELVNLEELDVSGCELVSLPDSLSQCESLVRLWLSNNRYMGTRTTYDGLGLGKLGDSMNVYN